MDTWKTLLVSLALSVVPIRPAAQGNALPNILWVTAEDINPHLGCYGDAYADTPRLDRFAARGLRYRHVWSTAPVCAPARTAIITGM
ncbi:MAG TPA: sulfatase-like hydrolase/transferase, partial [Verrucomicrobiota bacterium]|nr:sulfatase-like hydrolase/transferase [Verrucomicrobiota bacterium]